MEVTAPFGWKVRFPARALGIGTVVIASVGVLAYMQRDHDLRTLEHMDQVTSIRSAQTKQIIAQLARTEEKMDTLIYVSTLPDNEKKNLRLNMPTGMRRQLLDQERPR